MISPPKQTLQLLQPSLANRHLVKAKFSGKYLLKSVWLFVYAVKIVAQPVRFIPQLSLISIAFSRSYSNEVMWTYDACRAPHSHMPSKALVKDGSGCKGC
jgi:hypothetical protein